MEPGRAIQLRTIGHACLLILEDGEPIVATDPWLIGSVYWRSWWLEKYPSDAGIEMVWRSRFSLCDAFARGSFPLAVAAPPWAASGPASCVSELFGPRLSESHGFLNRTLIPLAWYSLSDNVRIVSVPVPFDDSLLIIDTPDAVIFNINDAAPRRVLLEQIWAKFNPNGKTAIVLKSYSPASAAALTFKNGIRSPLKTKKDFVQVVIGMSNALGASYFVPFASQALFNREDSKWANDHKVTYENLSEYWSGTKTRLSQP